MNILSGIGLIKLVIIDVWLVCRHHHHTVGVILSSGVFRRLVITIYQLVHLIYTLKITSYKRVLVFIVCIHVFYHYWWFIMCLITRLKRANVHIVIPICVCSTDYGVEAVDGATLIVASVLWWSKHRSRYTPSNCSHWFNFLISFLLCCIVLQFIYLFLITHFLVS